VGEFIREEREHFVLATKYTPGKTKNPNALISPLDGSRLVPSQYIIFDAPLGYAHKETGQYIDFLVFIDTPLDVAMARRILRDDFAGQSSLSDEQARTLKMNMERYLEFARAA
jgi:uridine kinase